MIQSDPLRAMLSVSSQDVDVSNCCCRGCVGYWHEGRLVQQSICWNLPGGRTVEIGVTRSDQESLTPHMVALHAFLRPSQTPLQIAIFH